VIGGGAWDLRVSPWESRREAMLDLFGKSKPFTMGPALQIDGQNARLLMEALSGRWDYDQDRRDRRTIWYYVANAFRFVSIESRQAWKSAGMTTT
jgi:hypothetical protein